MGGAKNVDCVAGFEGERPNGWVSPGGRLKNELLDGGKVNLPKPPEPGGSSEGIKTTGQGKMA